MWEIAILVSIILALVGWIIVSGGGGTRRVSAEASRLRAELERMRDVNEALRNSLEAAEAERRKYMAEMRDYIRDIERVKASLAGSRLSQEMLMKKYGLQPSPQLIDKILETSPMLDEDTKRALVRELLVGEVGEAVLEGLAAGKGINEIAATAGLPVTVVRSQIRELQVLGYVDERLAVLKSRSEL